jgi:hypothetical protein
MSLGDSQAFLLPKKGEHIMENPIWTYKEFWSLVITQVIAAATFFGGRYLAPAEFEIVMFLTGMFETVGLFLTGVFAHNRLQANVRQVQAAIRGIQQKH